MKYIRDKRYYRNMKKAIMAGASSGIVAGMFLVGSSTVFADTTAVDSAENPTSSYTQNTNNTGMHIMHRWNRATKINALANSLGLDKRQIRQELKSGKTLKQILQENGIVPAELDKAFNGK